MWRWNGLWCSQAARASARPRLRAPSSQPAKQQEQHAPPLCITQQPHPLTTTNTHTCATSKLKALMDFMPYSFCRCPATQPGMKTMCSCMAAARERLWLCAGVPGSVHLPHRSSLSCRSPSLAVGAAGPTCLARLGPARPAPHSTPHGCVGQQAKQALPAAHAALWQPGDCSAGPAGSSSTHRDEPLRGEHEGLIWRRHPVFGGGALYVGILEPALLL